MRIECKHCHDECELHVRQHGHEVTVMVEPCDCLLPDVGELKGDIESLWRQIPKDPPLCFGDFIPGQSAAERCCETCPEINQCKERNYEERR